MKRVVFIRHGESTWNAENRFTGWTNVELTERGREQARAAGELFRKEGYKFNEAFTSYLVRAQHTLDIILQTLGQDIPVTRSWELNEKCYGDLQGKNKEETAHEVGEERFLEWRRSFDVPPPELAPDDPRNPVNDPLYAEVPKVFIPCTESLKQVLDRVQPYWEKELVPKIRDNESILVSSHGNTIRAFKMMLENIPEKEIVTVNIPYAVPLVYEFDDDMHVSRSFYLGDKDYIEALSNEVAQQGKAL